MSIEKTQCSLCDNSAGIGAGAGWSGIPFGWGYWQIGTRRIKFCDECAALIDGVLHRFGHEGGKPYEAA